MFRCVIFLKGRVEERPNIFTMEKNFAKVTYAFWGAFKQGLEGSYKGFTNPRQVKAERKK